MATLDSNKVTGVSVVSNATDAVNANYVSTSKQKYQTPLASDAGKFLQYAGSAYYWNLRTSGFGSADIQTSSYGNGYYVIGGNQTLSSSTDTIVWSLRTTGTGQVFSKIVYGDQYTSGKDIFVGGGYFDFGGDGVVSSSVDSINWSLRTSGFGSTPISGATYSTLNGGEFLLGGASTPITTWWQLRTAGTTISPVSTIYGDLPVPTYLIRLFDTRFLKGSTDTITWIIRTNGGSGATIESISYGLVGDQPLYVSVDSNTQVNTSTDSITWTLRTSGSPTSGIFYTTAAGSLGLGKENFIAGGLFTTNIPYLKSSTDGIHWVARNSAGFGSTSISSSGYGGGYYFIGGSSANPPANSPLNVSTDGITWSKRTSGSSLNIYGFAYGTNNGVPNYIFHGQDGLIATSTDTNTWILRTAGSTSDIGLAGGSNGSGTAMTYNNGVYVYCNVGGGVRVSTDAIVWTLKDFPASVTAAYSIAYGNNYYFVGATGGILPVSIQATSTSQPLIGTYGLGALFQTSTDSITWTTRTTGYGTQSISALTFGGSYALAYGENDIGVPFLSASTDNITWTFRTSGITQPIFALTYENGIYIAAGSSGILNTSTNSIAWTLRTSGTSQEIFALTYGNNAYLSGTISGQIRFSSDGIIWSLRTSNSLNAIYTLTYGNNIYLSGEASGALETSLTGSVYWQSINLASSVLLPTYKGAEEFTTRGAQTFTIPLTASQFYIECVGAGGGGASGRIKGTLGSGGGGGAGAYNSWLIRRPELGDATSMTLSVGTGGQGGTNRGLSTSTDGIIWTVSPFDNTTLTPTIYASGYGNGLYVVAGNTVSVFVSTDASSWTLRTTGIALNQNIGGGYGGNAFVYGDKYVIAAIAGTNLSTSTDTITWTPRTVPFNITNIIYGNNLYLATSGYNNGNLLATSVDAVTWVLRTVGYTSSTTSRAISFANTANTGNENRYVYADGLGRFATSTNAIQWTFRTSGTSQDIYQMINDGTNYFGVGTAGTLIVSTNAIQWSFRTSGFGSTNINTIAYNSSLTEKYLIAGDAGLTRTSTDGFIWIARSSLFKNQNINTVSNANNIYIAGGSLTSTPTAGTATAVSWTGNGPLGTVTYLLGAGGGTAASDTAVTGGTGATGVPIYRNALYATDGLSGAAGKSLNGPANDSPTQVNVFQVTGGGGGAFNTNTGGNSNSYYYGNTYTTGGNASGASGADGIPGYYTGNIGGGGGGGGALSSGFNTWINRTSGFTNAVINLAYGSSTYLANNSIAGSGGLRGSTDSINWQLRTAGFGTTAIGSITYSTFNSGEFLAGGRVETQIWTQRTSGFNTALNAVMYDGTNFFAGGASGVLTASTDGIAWTLRTSGTTLVIGQNASGGNGLVYAAGQTYPYVLCGGTGLLSSSTNAVQWTLRTAAGNFIYSGITFGTSPTATYVIGSTFGRVNTSTDSINWVLRTSGNTGSTIEALVYNDSTTEKYVAVRAGGAISTSTNAIQWLQRTSGTGNIIYQVIYGTVFVAAGQSGFISTSTNAIQWRLGTSGNTSSIFGLAYTNGVYIASGNSGTTRSSTDAIIWVLRTSGFGTTVINNSVAANNIFINVGDAATITTSTQFALNSYGLGALLQASTDSITWTARTTSLNTQTITSLGFGGSYVFAHGTNYMNEVGFLNVSTNNIIWVSRTSGFGSTAITAFGYGASSPTAYYVAIGNNQLSASTDTITWEVRTTSFGANVVNAFVYGDKHIAAGAAGIIVSSTDTITWTLRTSGFGTSNISSLVYGNSVYVAAGASGTLAKSSDGIVWERRNSGFGTTAINALTYGTSYIAGGVNGTITVSAGGDSQSAAGNGGNGTRGGGGGGGAYSVEQGKFGIGGEGADGYVKITWW
jgi:hypothetical protein